MPFYRNTGKPQDDNQVPPTTLHLLFDGVSLKPGIAVRIYWTEYWSGYTELRTLNNGIVDIDSALLRQNTRQATIHVQSPSGGPQGAAADPAGKTGHGGRYVFSNVAVIKHQQVKLDLKFARWENKTLDGVAVE